MKNRILIITNILDTGATDNWLVRVCEIAAVAHPDWEWTFYCIDGRAGRLDERARRFGAKVVHSLYALDQKRAFFRSLRAFMKSHPHDIFHSQHDYLSAVYLWAALGLPFRKRIVHIHNTDEVVPTSSRLRQCILREPMRQTCLRLADHLIGVSHHTLAKFVRNRPPRPGRDKVLYCGIETECFRGPAPDTLEFRRSLSLPANAKILLFVGRMIPLKNPLFVLSILDILAKRDSSFVACFAGSGELEAEVTRRAQQMALTGRVRVLGLRDDIARIMRASDLFLFPRVEEPKEALGLVLVEAQAAGLPMLLSQAAPADAMVIPELIEIVPLSAGPEVWARRAAEIIAKPVPDRVDALKKVESSSFTLTASACTLMELYR